MTLSDILQQELHWLEKIIRLRIELPEADLEQFNLETFLTRFPHRKKNIVTTDKYVYDTTPPAIISENYTYSSIAKKCELEERLLLILALSVHLEPGFINKTIEQHHYSEIIKKTPNFWNLSGLTVNEKYGIIPTGRFWIYLFSGANFNKRVELINKISEGQFHLIASGIVDICACDSTEPAFGGVIKLEPAVLINFFSRHSSIIELHKI